MSEKENIKKLTVRYLDEIIAIRRHFHMNPELSFKEEATSKKIRDILDEWGVEYNYPFVEHGIVAELEGSTDNGQVIAIRSDMDALPIQEDSKLDFASKNQGVMHACGHDIHMSSLLGCIKILKELKNDFKGRILFIFQPGEEKLPGGAKLMMEEGIFKKFKPDYVLAQHVLPEMEVGNVGFKPGPYMASSDEIYIKVIGQGGHGALQENINDPVLMAAHILISLQQEINRKAPKKIPTVLSFGKVIANGAVNVIPDQVMLEGTFRTMDENWRKEGHRLIRQIAGGIASGMGGEVEVEVRNGYPVLLNNPELTGKARKLAAELMGEDHVTDMDIRMTAEDFAWFSHQYPSLLYRLGVKNPSDDKVYALHTSRFIADESALKTGMETMAWIALNLLQG